MQMRHHVGIGEEWGVKISTTSNTSDWCGMRASNIAGVVDLLVEDIEARVLAVGEVKPEATAECQVLAPLLLQKEKHGVCPVDSRDIPAGARWACNPTRKIFTEASPHRYFSKENIPNGKIKRRHKFH
jgi:hypothetical protein